VRVLVTGGGGFAGRHVMKDLSAAGHTPICFDLKPPENPESVQTITGDLRDADKLQKTLRDLRPDACIHLGGIAFVPMGWTDPKLVFSINLIGTINILEACRLASPETRLLVVTSAEAYGREARDHALKEDDPMLPSNPYAISKMSADLTALLYARRYAMPVMTARPGNHIGPGQSEHFVATAFAEQLIRIALKQTEPKMKVGNLETKRDFTDVRDVVRAYRLLIEKGRIGQAYNIAEGQHVRIQRILDGLCEIAGVHPEIEIDPARYRPTDTTPSIDISKIKRDVGWKPEIPFEDTLRDVLEDCRQRLAS